MKIQQVEISNIFPDKNQPRKYFDEEALERLKVSIKEKGVEQPIAVKIVDDKYVIVDGERRYRASQGLVNDMPCIIFDKDVTEDEILEYQLRTDCLKEELLVDELDMAIYRYYEYQKSTFKTSFKSPKIGRPSEKDDNHQLALFIGSLIGKSFSRVHKAIDRFEFKRDNQEFTKTIEKKYNPESKPYSKVNSTISMTDKLKDKPEIRKAVVEKILNTRKEDRLDINNNNIKSTVNRISEIAETPEEAVKLFDVLPQKRDYRKEFDKNPNVILSEMVYEFYQYTIKFNKYKFETVKEHLSEEKIIEFIEDVNTFLEKIKGELK